MLSWGFIQGNDKSDREQTSEASRSNLLASFVLSWMLIARAFLYPGQNKRRWQIVLLASA